MYPNVVKNQYIGKSKLDFYFKDTLMPNTTLFEDIGFKLESKEGIPFNSLNKSLPDYFVPICIKDLSQIDIALPEGNTFYTHVLVITGIPKQGYLKRYKLKNTIWESYYEDLYRGYLYQILPITSGKVDLELTLVNNNQNRYQIKLC